MLSLKNPHSVLAAMKARPRDIQEIRISAMRETREGESSASSGDAWSQVITLGKKMGIRMSSAPKIVKTERKIADDGRTSQTEALIRERTPLPLETIFQESRQKKSDTDYGLWLALDQLQDPHNVGSVFRTAAFFGVKGIIMMQDRSAALSATVYDVASGGVEDVPFTVIPNLQHAFELAKDRGLWILGTSEHAEMSWRSVPRDRDWLLVLGNEEKGMRRLTAESCDMVCQIPPAGKGVTSLNVSVAAGVLISKLA